MEPSHNTKYSDVDVCSDTQDSKRAGPHAKVKTKSSYSNTEIVSFDDSFILVINYFFQKGQTTNDFFDID